MLGIIEEMKERIPEHPVLKKELEKLIANGLSKDEALDVMIDAWLQEMKARGKQEYQRRIIYD